MKKYRIEIFKAKNREWCWRRMHRNGREIERASETYERKGTMLRVLNRMLRGFQDGDFEIVDA